MKSYLKFLSRNKLYTAIEAAGLIISFSVFIILMSQVWYDVTYDRSFSGSERVYLLQTARRAGCSQSSKDARFTTVFSPRAAQKRKVIE